MRTDRLTVLTSGLEGSTVAPNPGGGHMQRGTILPDEVARFRKDGCYVCSREPARMGCLCCR